MCISDTAGFIIRARRLVDLLEQPTAATEAQLMEAAELVMRLSDDLNGVVTYPGALYRATPYAIPGTGTDKTGKEEHPIVLADGVDLDALAHSFLFMGLNAQEHRDSVWHLIDHRREV